MRKWKTRKMKGEKRERERVRKVQGREWAAGVGEKQEEKEGNSLKAAELALHVAACRTL